MSPLRWFTSRAIPLCIFGGAAFYLLSVSHTTPSSQKYLLLGFLAVLLISLFSRGLYSHPAYAPGMLCLFIGILLYNSWQQNGPHAQGTILLGILLGVLILINFTRLSRSPDL